MQENVELKKYTSMCVGGKARYFLEAKNNESLIDALEFAKSKNLQVFILGGGSNVIISDNGFDGLVIKISIKGVASISETEDSVLYEVGAGEFWDGLVGFVVKRGLYGIENLSHIPGTVGASVVQNIGAYGQEVSSSVVSVKVLNRNTLKEEVLSKDRLNFSYRKSCLNDVLQDKNKYVVLSVRFNLKIKGELNLNYQDTKRYFDKHSDLAINLVNLRRAIIEIREEKFPFPVSPDRGTVGSFWNADVIDEKTYEDVILKLESMGFFEKANDMKVKKSVFTVSQGLKVPYGVLVEVLGFKGKVFDKAKILDTHSCVINNFSGKATAKEIIDISNTVVLAVKKEFGIDLKVEPELVGDFK